jgi:hypothetical protein
VAAAGSLALVGVDLVADRPTAGDVFITVLNRIAAIVMWRQLATRQQSNVVDTTGPEREGASWAIASLSAITAGSDTGRPWRVPFCLAAAMPALTRSMISSRSYSARVASMFSISRPVEGAGSMPSEMDRTCMPRARSRVTVLSTSISDRPQAVDPPHHDGVALLGVVEELFHSGSLACSLATRSHGGEDVAFLHAGGDQRVQLQLGILTGSADARISKLPHQAILTRKVPDAPSARR